MSSPQHFDGLEEDKITWHSNSKRPRLIGPTVWEAEEITGYSNTRTFIFVRNHGLKATENVKEEKLQGSQEGYAKGPNRKLESRTLGCKRK